MTIFRAPERPPRHHDDEPRHRALIADVSRAVGPLATAFRFISRQVLSLFDYVYFDEKNSRVGIGTSVPQVDLHISRSDTADHVELRMTHADRTWRLRLHSNNDDWIFTDVNTGNDVLRLSSGADDELLVLGGLASGSVEINGILNLQQTSTAAPATTTEYPNDGDVGVHHDTAGGKRFWVWNDGGTIYSVQMT